ncbi:hypothetical protein CFP56_027971 [Quercus suber]|uniref:Expansin-like EG45 domain-containing protein n=1 Tax=Quercus suber TaxID=58331 RepID=A0AAW0JX55_QUESU
MLFSPLILLTTLDLFKKKSVASQLLDILTREDCGYEDILREGYGLNSYAAMSNVLFNNGQTCACYKIRCTSYICCRYSLSRCKTMQLCYWKLNTYFEYNSHVPSYITGSDIQFLRKGCLGTGLGRAYFSIYRRSIDPSELMRLNLLL